MLAAFVAAGAAVPVMAYDSTAALIRIDQVYDISRISENTTVGVNPNTTFALGFRFALDFYSDSTYYIEVTINKNSSASADEIFSDNCIYANYTNEVQTSIEPNSGNIIDGINTYIIEDTDTITKYAIVFNTSGLSNDSYMTCFAYLLKNTSILSFSYINTSAYFTVDENQTELEIITGKLDEIISNQNNNTQEITKSLNQIINNQIIQNNNWQTLITYGSDYNQIDKTIINDLGSAEDKLNSAEDAIQNKSKSLIQRAASGIASAKTASTTLVSALSTTVPQIVSSTTDLIETAPEEVQAAVLSIPLLSFAAWLIGLKK